MNADKYQNTVLLILTVATAMLFALDWLRWKTIERICDALDKRPEDHDSSEGTT